MTPGSRFDESMHGCVETYSHEHTVYGDIVSEPEVLRAVESARRTMRRIGIVLCEGFSLLRVGAIAEVFQLANERALACSLRGTSALAYDVRLLSTPGGSVRSASSARVLTECIEFDERNRFDALFAVGGNAPDTDAVRSALALIKRDLGHNVAREICERVLPSAEARADELLHDIGLQTMQEKIRASALWLDENYNRMITIADAARVAVMSSRSFSRHFKLELGVTPSEYLLRARLKLVCRMLTDTDLPVEKIARRCGVGGGDRLGKIFRKIFRVSPTEYRQAGRAAPKPPPAVRPTFVDADACR